MDNNNNNSNPQNNKNQRHGGRHKYNRHRSKSSQPKDQKQVTQAPPAAAEGGRTENFQPRHSHSKKNHKSKHRPANQEAELLRSSEVGAPISESAADTPPEVIFINDPTDTDLAIRDLGVKQGDPDMSLFEFEDNCGVKDVLADDPAAVEVIGVRFRQSGKIYYFDPRKIKTPLGTAVIVETARGPEFGEVFMANKHVSEQNIVQPLRPLIRIATDADKSHNENNRIREKDAFNTCLEKIAKHGLEMKLVEAQYTFDNSKLLFYFTSAGRVDFRELVKDLASVFRTRIELRQIGIRDEAKLLGGLGACGRALCCSGFLSDFVQVSIKMAKEQNLSLNSNKISGTCGRLMCCLRYESDTYVEEIRQTPPVESVVRTPDGTGTVTEINPLAGLVKVRISDKQDNTILKTYHRDLVTVVSRPRTEEDADQKNGKNNQENQKNS